METPQSAVTWRQGMALPTLPWADALNISQKKTSTAQGLLLMWRLRRAQEGGKEKGRL